MTSHIFRGALQAHSDNSDFSRSTNVEFVGTLATHGWPGRPNQDRSSIVNDLKSLVLLGNASNYISETRRDLIIGKLSKKKRSLSRVLKSACKKNKPKGALLFGPAVYKALSKRVDTLAAFNKTAGKAQGRKPDGKFSRGSPAFRDSGTSGKFFSKPFHNSGQKIYMPPKPQH